MAGENILTGIGDLTGKLVGLFDNGVSIYQGIQSRLDALKGIAAETPAVSPPVVMAPSPAQNQSDKEKTAQGLNNVSLLLIAAGAIVVLLVIALRRK